MSKKEATNYLIFTLAPEAGAELKAGWSVLRSGEKYALKEGEKIVEKEAVEEVVQYSDDLVKAAQQLYPKKAGKLEWHHVEPMYLGGAKDGLIVQIDATFNQVITNEFRNLHPYGLGQPEKARVQKIMKDVYTKFPLPLLIK